MSRTETPPLRKAYELNHGGCVFGALAEIGAGQEVARTFFQAGKAAQSIAKSMSAYAMEVSDDIYMTHGDGTFDESYRISYTSRYRLLAMLHHEHHLMTERFIVKPLSQPRQEPKRKTLAEKRGFFPCLFSYANTFSTGDVHYGMRDTYSGWMGVRVQSREGGFHGTLEEIGWHVDLLAHVVLLEQDRKGQYETIGTMGVNLIEAAVRLLSNPKAGFDELELVGSLFDGVRKWKVRMDVLEVNPSDHIRKVYKTFVPNNRELSLRLVHESLSHDTLLSTYNSKVPGELCSNWHAKAYPEWSSKLQAWHSQLKLIDGEGIDAWAFPQDHVREPTRFLARRHVCLVRGEVVGSRRGERRIHIPDSVARWISEVADENLLPVVVLPIQDLAMLANRVRFDFAAFDEAYQHWLETHPKSAVLITRSSDLAWVVESVRRSLGEDRPDQGRVPFTVVFDGEQWLDQLRFDFEAHRKRFAEDVKSAEDVNSPKHEQRLELKRDWEQLSSSELDCLQRIDRAGCVIDVLCTNVDPGACFGAAERSDLQPEQREDENQGGGVKTGSPDDPRQIQLRLYLEYLLSTGKLKISRWGP